MRIYGGTYVLWDKRQMFGDSSEMFLILKYTPHTKLALSIAPEEKNNSTVRVATGWEPPQEFIESELAAGIDFVQVDKRVVWSRDGEIPF